MGYRILPAIVVMIMLLLLATGCTTISAHPGDGGVTIQSPDGSFTQISSNSPAATPPLSNPPRKSDEPVADPAQVEQLAARQQQLQSAIAQKERKLTDLQTATTQAAHDLQQLIHQRDDARGSVAQAHADLGNLRNDLQALATKHAEETQKFEKEETIREQTGRQAVARQAQQEKDRQAELGALDQALTQRRQANNTLIAQDADLKKQDQALTQQIRQAQDFLDGLKAHCDELIREVAVLEIRKHKAAATPSVVVPPTMPAATRPVFFSNTTPPATQPHAAAVSPLHPVNNFPIATTKDVGVSTRPASAAVATVDKPVKTSESHSFEPVTLSILLILIVAVIGLFIWSARSATAAGGLQIRLLLSSGRTLDFLVRSGRALAITPGGIEREGGSHRAFPLLLNRRGQLFLIASSRFSTSLNGSPTGPAASPVLAGASIDMKTASQDLLQKFLVLSITAPTATPRFPTPPNALAR